ncbi:hypothetical protein LOD99_12921 [Oopsacas minuta]|uniref:NAC-A/B domain-containing protein n=1 Tax=Oopsacas minuta TaxID=111878 RepID=A0AAV7J8C5_9METZ|nr:hypothetical protein LOD99_12921 [Oopsacas minuta]
MTEIDSNTIDTCDSPPPLSSEDTTKPGEEQQEDTKPPEGAPYDTDSGSSDSDSDGEGPNKSAGATSIAHPDTDGRNKQCRAEKKARKAMSKLGLKLIPGVAKVTIKKSKNLMFVINKPDVYKSPVSDTYIVFGDAKVEDFPQQSGLVEAARGIQAPTKAPIPEETATEGAKYGEGSSSGDEADQDATGLEQKDIDLVMQQAGVSKNKAIKALKANNNDLVTAIMELTM